LILALAQFNAAAQAQYNIGYYLMDYYRRRHTFNDGMRPVVAEEKLKILSGIS